MYVNNIQRSSLIRSTVKLSFGSGSTQSKTNIFWPFCLLLIAQLLGPGFAMATSPPGPPEPTLEEALIGSSVIVAEGIKLHWIARGDKTSGVLAREVSGPDEFEPGRGGSVLLEAEVTSFVHCVVPCNRGNRIFIFLNRLDIRKKAKGLVGKRLIYLFRDAMFDVQYAFPPELQSKWLVLSRDAAINPLPLSELETVSAALKKAGPSSQKHSNK